MHTPFLEEKKLCLFGTAQLLAQGGRYLCKPQTVSWASIRMPDPGFPDPPHPGPMSTAAELGLAVKPQAKAAGEPPASSSQALC